MNKRPLLSIVVPTKDRYFYLKKLIKLIDSYHFGDEVEMVIQDNTEDNSEIVSFLKEGTYNFIVYDHHSDQLPISLNSDKAVLNSSGEYVCFIGDDDGVTKYIVEGVKWMKENQIDAVKSAEVYYIWPDAINATNVSRAAVVDYREFTGSVRYVSAYKELLKVLTDGIPDRGNMPLVYHGVVSRRVLDEIYKKCGTYFPGNSPDIANAVAVSLTAKKFAIVNLPWAIYGSCVSKGGGERLPGRRFPPQIKDIKHWPVDAEEKWYEKIPKVAIWVTIWPESAISALRAYNRTDLIDKFNVYRHYARFIIAYPSLKNYVFEVCDKRTKIYLNLVGMHISRIHKAFWRRIGWSLGYNRPLHVDSVNTIIEAAAVLEKLSNGEIKNK